VAEGIGVSLEEVDAHNVVPCWCLPKAEYGAYTLRPKLKRLWPMFLEDFPALAGTRWGGRGNGRKSLEGTARTPGIGPGRAGVTWISPGSGRPGGADAFPGTKVAVLWERRNDPTLDGQSDLSRISISGIGAQRVALEVGAATATTPPGRPS